MENKNVNILELCVIKNGNGFNRTGMLSGKCYMHHKRAAYIDDAIADCSMLNGQLPVPSSEQENQLFVTTYGETFLGIEGELDGGVVTWRNIYTQVNQSQKKNLRKKSQKKISKKKA